jgi:hypothetical protein
MSEPKVKPLAPCLGAVPDIVFSFLVQCISIRRLELRKTRAEWVKGYLLAHAFPDSVPLFVSSEIVEFCRDEEDNPQ